MTIVERSELKLADLHDLYEGRIVALRCPGYYQADEAEAIAQLLSRSELRGKYVNAPAIARIGQAYFESQASPEISKRYRTHALEWVRTLRQTVSPSLSPVDRIRLELDEVWPAGANIASLDGAKMFVGLAREFGEQSEAEPHQDVLLWDAPHSREALPVTSQLAWNVYLSMPEQGGELTLWDIALDRAGYERRRISGSYGVRRDMLPDPVATISPKVGEMILFNATKVHAVERIVRGKRITWSAFIGYQGDSAPLVVWS